MLLVTRGAAGLAARFVSPVGIFDCAGARSAESERLLRAAYTRGGAERVRSLRSDAHQAGPHCWLHAPRFCLSELEPGAAFA
jgi:protein-L-isoaspartate(D-aspartate) O-methyltransferase